ncbi:MAG: cytochrome c [Azonexaceae bacterium]|nr:cytochrome c [Azonexaceae bacterium]
MRKSLKNCFLLLSTALLLAACGAPEDTRPGQPVKTRQEAFKDILRSFEPMGKMLREDRYDADRFLGFAEAVVAKRDGPWSHFGPDTDYPPTKATPAVWQQPEKFEAERQAFFKATDALLEAARSKDAKQVDAPYKAAYDTCKSCHSTFKAR